MVTGYQECGQAWGGAEEGGNDLSKEEHHDK